MLSDSKTNLHEIIEEVLELKPKTVQAIYKAKNKAITRTKTEARREVQSRYNIKTKDVAKTITIKKATSKDLNASIGFKSGATPIISPMLRTQKLPTGKRKKASGIFKEQKIKVVIKKGNAKILKTGTNQNKPFLMRLKSGGSKTIVAVRLGKKRYSTKQIRTLSIASMVNNQSIVKLILQTSREEYYKEFDRLMKLGDKV